MDIRAELSNEILSLSGAVFWLAAEGDGSRYPVAVRRHINAVVKFDTAPEEAYSEAARRRGAEDAADAEERQRQEKASKELFAALQSGTLVAYDDDGRIPAHEFVKDMPFVGGASVDSILNANNASRLHWGAAFEDDWRDGNGDTIEDAKDIRRRRIRVQKADLRKLWSFHGGGSVYHTGTPGRALSQLVEGGRRQRRRKGGAKPQFPWARIKDQCFEILNDYGGITPDDPEMNSRNKLVSKLQEWCLKEIKREPGASTLKDRLSQWIPEWEAKYKRPKTEIP